MKTIYAMSTVALLGSTLLADQPVFTGSGASMHVLADFRDADRKMIRTTTTLPSVRSGELHLWYPLFVPGNHAPSGPIQNLAEFRVRDAEGNRLDWRREASEPARMSVDVPRGYSGPIFIETTYLASQPWHMSRSSDSYGFDNFGAVNWNTVLWYPESANLRRATVDVEVLLPEGHTHAWALGGLRVRDVPFMRLIDSPIIFGEHVTTVELPAPERGYPPHFIHLVASERENTILPEWMIGPLAELTQQARLVFGDFPREHYHYLTMVDSSLSFGLEHSDSTFISARTDAFSNADRPDEYEGGMGHLTVIPHEYIHVWCGKLAAPEGIVRENYHDPIDTSLLWVYEGLTTYYTTVLAARSGMISAHEYRERVLASIERYENQPGRSWRPIVDTARDVVSVRMPNPGGNELRRGADYYGDAALFWMEADAIIRRGTGGRRSLDDFCRDFFDVRVRDIGDQQTYTRDDVVAALRRTYSGENWNQLILNRIERPAESLSYDHLIHLLAQNRVFTSKPTELQRRAQRGSASIDLRHAAGFAVDRDGRVTTVTEGGAAAQAGLARGDRIIGVGEMLYSRSSLLAAVIATETAPASLDLLVARGDRLSRLEIRCDGSRRFVRLVPQNGQLDLIAAISAPRER